MEDVLRYAANAYGFDVETLSFISESTNKVYDQHDRLIDYGQSHTTSSYYFQALVTREEMLSYYQKEFIPLTT